MDLDDRLNRGASAACALALLLTGAALTPTGSASAAVPNTAPVEAGTAKPGDSAPTPAAMLGGRMGHGKGGCRHGKGGHGGGAGGRHGHHREPAWKASLSQSQRQALMNLKVAHRKVVVPLELKMKAIEAELAALATADDPDKGAIEAKIDELVWLERLSLIEKYRHMAAKRETLTPAQRLEFDMAAMQAGKEDRHGRHGKCHR
jgi:Spy/CpxP family protein refolding chaperone